MTRERLKQCLNVLRWSYREAAGWLECDQRQFRRWVADPTILPEPIAIWLENLAQFHEANPPPPPAAWRQRQRKAVPCPPSPL